MDPHDGPRLGGRDPRAGRTLKRAGLTILAGLGLLCGCSRPAAPAGALASPAPSRPAVPASATPLEMRSVRVGSKYIYVTEQKKNRKIYSLRADEQRAQYFGENTGRSEFKNPHVTFYDRNGRSLIADAPTGTVFEREKSVVMSGGVRAHTADGKTLTCRTLRYNDATEKLHGEGDVVLTSPDGEQLRGEELDADLRLSQLHVTGSR